MGNILDDDATGADSVAAKLESLGIHLDPGIPYRLESMFPRLEGWGAKGELKRKGKIIRNVEPKLAEMLRDGEEVLYIAKGVQYSFAEHYFMGVWAMTINQTVFVLTNVRLIMLRTNSSGVPKETAWMVYYSQIEKLKGGWTGMMSLKLDDGRKLQFSGFSKLDRSTMPQVFEQALEKYREHGFEPEVTQSLENLCGYCHGRVPKDEYECRRCGAEFWKPSAVALRSLVFPSWGDFVLKHYVVMGVELIGYAVTWIVAGVLVIAALSGGGDPLELLIAVGLGAFFIAIAHTVDGAVTYFVAKKGLHPRRGPTHETVEDIDEVLVES